MFRLPFLRCNDTDVWYRHLILLSEQPKKFAKPAAWVKYFGSKMERPEHDRPWVLEMSGRAIPPARSIEENAEAVASRLNDEDPERQAQFRGVLAGEVAAIRQASDALDVYLDPDHDDPAHANLVVTNETGVTPEGKIHPGLVFALYDQFAIRHFSRDSDDMQALEARFNP